MKSSKTNERTRKGWTRKLLAGALALVMLLSSTGLLQAMEFFGTEGSGSPAVISSQARLGASKGATEGVSERVADANTMESYQTMLLGNGNSRYAGRLWADKSVIANSGGRASVSLSEGADGINGSVETEEDFLHVYSLLGSSQVVNEYTPADLVLALDISGSMGSSEANEVESWVYAAAANRDGTVTYDPDNPQLGYYENSKKTAGWKDDDNAIPDKVIPLMPESNEGGYNGVTNQAGQMTAKTLIDYNSYLNFCNTFINALKGAYAENQYTPANADEIDAKIDAIPGGIGDKIKDTGFASYIKLDKQTDNGYKELYKIYWRYKFAADKADTDDINPWASDAKKNHKVIWPYNDWENWDGWAAAHDNPMAGASNAPNRMHKMINAANEFIDSFLALNPKNRISVVVYDSVATVLMPLATYEKKMIVTISPPGSITGNAGGLDSGPVPSRLKQSLLVDLKKTAQTS